MTMYDMFSVHGLLPTSTDGVRGDACFRNGKDKPMLLSGTAKVEEEMSCKKMIAMADEVDSMARCAQKAFHSQSSVL